MLYTYHCTANGKKYHGNKRLFRLIDQIERDKNHGMREIAKDISEFGTASFYETLYSPEPVQPKKKEVMVQIDGDGLKVATYDSVEDAAKALGKKSSKYLAKEIQGDGKAYGFTWKIEYV